MTKVYLISGHSDLTTEEFNNHYIDKINEVISDKDANFILADNLGVDFLAQKYLSKVSRDLENLHERITVYHFSEFPKYNLGNFRSIRALDNDDLDVSLVESSSNDIIWIRPKEKQSKKINYNVYHLNRPVKILLIRENKI